MLREEKANVTKPTERTGTKMSSRGQRGASESGIGQVTQREKKNAETDGDVKWSGAMREIKGMKVRDGEHKIMEGGREIEKGTLGSGNKSV